MVKLFADIMASSLIRTIFRLPGWFLLLDVRNWEREKLYRSYLETRGKVFAAGRLVLDTLERGSSRDLWGTKVILKELSSFA